MRKALRNIGAIAAMLALNSCGDIACFDATGPLTTERQIVVGEWQSIKNLTEGSVFYTQQDTFLVMIDADQRLFETILVQNVSGNLVIDIDEDCLQNVDMMRFNIFSPQFTGIENRGEGHFIAADTVLAPEISITSSGKGNVEFNKLISTNCTVNHTGSGNVQIIGLDTCAMVNINHSGIGNIQAYQLIAGDVTVTNSGSGQVQVHCSGVLNVTISGSGDVYYKGAPTAINPTITGSGQLINAN